MMNNFMRNIALFFRAHWRGTVIILIVIASSFLTLNTGFQVVKSNDAVCQQCHILAPHHRSWEASSHADIACIKCHNLEFSYFTDALAKTLTGNHPSVLTANVPDQSCLQSGCHSGEQTVSRDSGFGTTLAFDHATHLTEMRRGERLRCTSCHTSDQNSETHFTTNTNTCNLCHFKGAEESSGSYTECVVCHTTPPAEVTHEGFSFDHSSYVELGVACEECHVEVTSGTGQVLDSKCYECHDERVDEKQNFRIVHDKHVTEKGIGCFQCHENFEHKSVRFVSTLEADCNSCHDQSHNLQKQVYLGTGGEGIPNTPSRMFAAKVSCEGCHEGPPMADGQHAVEISSLQVKRDSCVRCHGEGFDEMLDVWMDEINKSLAYAASYEREASALLTSLDSETDKEMIESIQGSLKNINLIRQGGGVHNVEYSVKLISSSVDNISDLLKKFDRPNRLATRPAVLQGSDGYCMELCHKAINTHAVEFFDDLQLDFDHSTHEDVASCTECHSAEKHKQRVIEKDGCMDCHHTVESQDEYGVGCEDCHASIVSFYEGDIDIPGIEFEADIMAQADTACLDCHTHEAQYESLDDVIGRCNSCHVEYGAEPENVTEWLGGEAVAHREITDDIILKLDRLTEETRYLPEINELRRKLAQADSYLDIIVKGHAHHNFAASSLITEKINSLIAEVEGLLQ
jgi:hypothetical protein